MFIDKQCKLVLKYCYSMQLKIKKCHLYPLQASRVVYQKYLEILQLVAIFYNDLSKSVFSSYLTTKQNSTLC